MNALTGTFSTGIKDHLLIIDYLSARDHHAARDAMEKHLMKGRENIAHYFN